jgi:putative hydrolase of the HAD superfamily
LRSLPRALLLDLDDTILSFGEVAMPAWQQVCETHAATHPDLSADPLRAVIKETSDVFWSDPERHRRGRFNMIWARRQIVSQAFDRLGVDAPELARAVADDFTRLREELVYAFPGAIEAVRAFRERGVRLAMVTNGASEMQRAKIVRFELEPFFETILVEGEWGAGKPDPSIFQEALRRLGDLEVEEAWMVGDNLEVDIAGAQGIGLHAVWNDHRRQGLPETTPVRPDRVICHLSELL